MRYGDWKGKEKGGGLILSSRATGRCGFGEGKTGGRKR